MQRTLVFGFLALLLCAVGLGAAQVGSQPRQAVRLGAPRCPWPPPPERLVVLDSEGSTAPQQLGPQQLWSAYVVPAGQDLVVTNVSLLGTDMALLVPGFGGAPSVRRGELEPRLASDEDPGAPLGYPFPSGSQVVIQNRGSGLHPLRYRLAGYLVPR